MPDYLNYIILAAFLWFFLPSLASHHRKRAGKFSMIKHNRHLLSFTSDFGDFIFDFKEGCLHINDDASKRKVPLKAIIGIKFSHDEKLTLHTERRGNPNRLPDLNNVIHWYTIKLILKDAKEESLFMAGQFEPRNFLGNWISQAEMYIYEKLGLVDDVEGLCREVLETITRSFKEARLELPLI